MQNIKKKNKVQPSNKVDSEQQEIQNARIKNK